MLQSISLPPRSGDVPKSAVIILHGLGDSSDGIIGLGEAWAKGLPETEFIAPDAPFPCDMAPFGFQWFSMLDASPDAILKGVKKAAPLLDEFIDKVMASRGLPPEKVALAGFSQGSMMSLYVAPRREQALAGVLGYSGALVGAEALPRERRSIPPIMLAHGTADDVVPFKAMALAEAGLHNANLNVSALVCPGLGHSISDDGLAKGLAFLRKILG